jgi:hypothetical protein
MRLCRLMCGKPLAFRYSIFPLRGYASQKNLGQSP